MERKIERFLQKWKADIIRKPLILFGPKQVGKTYSVLDFGKKEYKNMIYLVKTTDREVKLFTSEPTKVKHHYLVDSGEEEQDHHGHFHKVKIPSKEYFECWEDDKGGYGIRFDISNFSDEIIKQLEYDKVLVIN